MLGIEATGLDVAGRLGVAPDVVSSRNAMLSGYSPPRDISEIPVAQRYLLI
jgi:hypothetical protein